MNTGDYLKRTRTFSMLYGSEMRLVPIWMVTLTSRMPVFDRWRIQVLLMLTFSTDREL